MKTFILRKEDVKREWFTVDVKDKILGRVASQIAIRLMGKHKTTYTPHVDSGDFIVVTNAKEIGVTGRKLKQKKYYRHSGYLGYLKTNTLTEKLDEKPEDVIVLAVKRMLPKNKLGDQMLKRLKVYVGSENPHMAQNPQVLELEL